MKLAQRVQNVEKSLTLEITARAKKLKKDGCDVVNFAAGEPDFDTPSFIKDAAVQSIRDGFTKYTPSTGIPDLKEEISRKFKSENKLDYPPNQIVVSCGAKHSLYNIFQALTQEDDEVIMSSPYWVSYPEMVKLSGAIPKIIMTSQQGGFKIDIAELKKVITKKTKVLIINSPSNPAGIVYNRKELEEIADICVSRKIFIVSDEIYEKLIYDNEEHVSIGSLGKEVLNLTITVNGVSKAFAMTGWRIGYLGGPEDIIDAIGKIQSHSTSNPSSISQKAAHKALRNVDWTNEIRCEFQRRRDYMCDRLSKISRLSFVKPTGAFYVFCNIAITGFDSITFEKKILEDQMVAVIPGIAFGCDAYIRLSFATSIDSIKKGMDRLEEWVRR
jgi:aspartate aminotransferase